jgi:hypothetical protein
MMQLPPIAAAELENLRLVCRELGIPAASFEWLEWIPVRIMFSEAMGRDKSVPQRKRKLQHVAQLARQLNDALQGLENLDQSAIHQGFKGLQIRMMLDPPDPIREVFRRDDGMGPDLWLENVLLLGDVLLTLASVAKEADAALTGPLKGGRPRDLLTRVSHLTEVARFAHKHGIPVDRGRRFVRLAEAVFSAAGIAVSPESAIRVFVDELLPDLLPIWEEEGAIDDEEGRAASG